MRAGCLVGLLVASLYVISSVGAARTKYKMDFDWRFNLGDVSGAENYYFDDDDWRVLSIPHDFVVEGVFNETADINHGYLPYGIGWYRKHFTMPLDARNKAIWLVIDGTQTSSKVYLNGGLLGSHNTGYTSYYFSLTSNPNILFGEENILALRVDCTNPDSWWYDGGGIYRHVWIIVSDLVHVQQWGVWANSAVDGEISRQGVKAYADALITPETTIVNEDSKQASFYLIQEMRDSEDSLIASSTSTSVIITSGGNATVNQEMSASSLSLWSIDTPVMYTLRTLVMVGGVEVDRVETPFGVRKIAFDPSLGFFLNDESVKVKGLANHQDFAGLGVAVADTLQTWRVQKLKEMGGNAWRCAHNPPNPELLDACDTVGFLVWDENHRNNVDADGIADLYSMLYRDRNHPSIVYWSLCNEALCNDFNTANGQVLSDIVHSVDPTRPVTAAMNYGWETKFPTVLDVVGINYNTGEYDILHKELPTKPITASETSSALSDRGMYYMDSTGCYLSSYDVNYPSWGATAEDGWAPVDEKDFMEGSFVWTGFDYKGEPTPYAWPNVNSHFGIIDIAGFPKDAFYLYQSMWGTSPIVHIFPHWNTPIGVSVTPCSTTSSQQKWTYSGTSSKAAQIISSDGLCVTAACSSPNTGCMPLTTTQCDADNLDQMFTYSGKLFKSSSNGGCMDLWNSGTNVYVGDYKCDGNSNQNWVYDTSSGHIISSYDTSLCLSSHSHVEVWVYTNGASAELFVNGNSQGIQQVAENGHAAWPQVLYESGTLSAIAYDSNGNQLDSASVETTGTAYSIALDVELGDRDSIYADSQDIALVKASVLDASGRVVPTAAYTITFAVDGVGTVVGAGNGDPSCHEPDKADYRTTFNGLARVIVGQASAPGTIKLTATSPALVSATISIPVVAPPTVDPTL